MSAIFQLLSIQSWFPSYSLTIDLEILKFEQARASKLSINYLHINSDDIKNEDNLKSRLILIVSKLIVVKNPIQQ